MSGPVPTTGAEWRALLGLLFGGVVGLIFRPLVWPMVTAWLPLLVATACAETYYNATARGDTDLATPSGGILQFQPSTWSSLGYSSADIDYPAVQGRAAAANVQGAILFDWRWLALWIPFLRYPMMRLLWRHGRGAIQQHGFFGGLLLSLKESVEKANEVDGWIALTIASIVLLVVVAMLRYGFGGRRG